MSQQSREQSSLGFDEAAGSCKELESILIHDEEEENIYARKGHYEVMDEPESSHVE